MSSVFGEETAAERVRRFVAATSGYSLRGAAALAHVSHSLVDGWRKWLEQGADPNALPPPEPETLQKLGDYLVVAQEVEIRRVAMGVAADRLVELAKQLREEATGLSEAQKKRLAAGKQKVLPRPDALDGGGG